MKILFAVLLGLGWFAAVITGFIWMDRYEAAPGSAATVRSDNLSKVGKWRFVLVVASYCPCSRASISALKAAVDSHPESTLSEVVFIDQPKASDWLYQKAKSIRNCKITTSASDRHGALTSGQAFLYQPNGKLAYSGGLTQGRGIDDSRFAMKLYDEHRTEGTARKNGAVFGCELVGASK